MDGKLPVTLNFRNWYPVLNVSCAIVLRHYSEWYKKQTSSHCFIFYTHFLKSSRTQVSAWVQLSYDEGRVTPWTSNQLITGPHGEKTKQKTFTLTFTPADSLELPIAMFCMFLDCGRKQENLRKHRENMQTPYRKVPGPELNILQWGGQHSPLHHCVSTKCVLCELGAVQMWIRTQYIILQMIWF